MTTTELITTTTTLSKEYHFKNEALNLCAAKIAEELNASIEFGVKVLNANNKRDVFLAKVLGTVQENGYYKDDGFKSAAEFAMATFGLEKDYCYKLAQAGKTFYNSDSAAKQRAVAMIGDSPSKIVELKNVSEDVLTAAMDDGRLHPGMTQKELRDFAKTVKEPNKLKIAKDYVAYFCEVAGHLYYREIKGLNEADAITGGRNDNYIITKVAESDIHTFDEYVNDVESGTEGAVKLAVTPGNMYMVYNKTTGVISKVEIAVISDGTEVKRKKSKPRTINVLACTLDDYIVYMGGDVHDDDDREFYERKLAKVRAQCKPAE